MLEYAKYAPITQGIMRVFVAHHIRRGLLCSNVDRDSINLALSEGVVSEEICKSMALRGYQVVKTTSYSLAGEKYMASITVWEYVGIDKAEKYS